MKQIARIGCLWAGLLALGGAQDSLPSDVYASVLRIEAATQTPDYETPWNSGGFGGGIGTGFIIGKNRILTNAHVVSDARRLLVTTHGKARKYLARVEFIAHDCDLALLSLEDFSDFESFPTFTFGDVPKLESHVRVIGYPVGGDRLSVTRGVVSRIDFQEYSHSRSDSHLVVQIDAAINPGNSGGPVLQGDQVVGVAFQGLRTADNTGYIIPTPVIRRFIKDVEDGRYDKYAELGLASFELHNPTMRQALGLPDNGLGILVLRVSPGSSADGCLKPGDVLIGMDGKPVDNAGMVEIDGESMNVAEIVERKFAGDVVTAEVLRDGKPVQVPIALKPLPAASMYSIQYETRPRYLVFAGLVFQPLDTNLLATIKPNDLTVRSMYSNYVSKGLFEKHPDIVMLTRVESDPVTSLLGEFAGRVVKSINGQEVRDLKHAHELLHPKEPPRFHVIELHGASRPVIIPAAAVDAANRRVAERYGIQSLSRLDS